MAANETVGERLAKAQASGDLNQLRTALEDARAAGADEKYIEAAMAELDRLTAEQAKTAAAGAATAEGSGQDPAEGAADAVDAAELRAKAEACKKQGNERLKTNTKTAAREALDCFTRGIELHCSDLVLNAQLYSNRAHVRMLLRQFVEVVDDCRKAIELDPKNIKAYWRAAKASMHLDLCRNGLEFCEQGLKQEPSDADLAKLRDNCAERLSVQQQRRARGPSRTGASGAGEFSADEAMALQDKVNGLGEQIDSLRMSMAKKQREKMSAQLTQNALKETPEEAPLYQGVGRCFLKQERPDVDSMLSKSISGLEEELPKLSTAYQELEKRKQEAEKELQEVIDAFRRQTADASAAGAA